MDPCSLHVNVRSNRRLRWNCSDRTELEIAPLHTRNHGYSSSLTIQLNRSQQRFEPSLRCLNMTVQKGENITCGMLAPTSLDLIRPNRSPLRMIFTKPSPYLCDIQVSRITIRVSSVGHLLVIYTTRTFLNNTYVTFK